VVAVAPDARSSCALTADSDHSGLSANRAGLLNAQSWRLIIVWLEVRVRPAPPRSLAQTEISQFITNSPELARIRLRISLCRLSIGCAGGDRCAIPTRRQTQQLPPRHQISACLPPGTRQLFARPQQAGQYDHRHCGAGAGGGAHRD
jgi:hypothetical protein